MIDAAPTIDKSIFITAPEQASIADKFQRLLSFETVPSHVQLKKACQLIIDGTIAQEEGMRDEMLNKLHTTLALDYPYALEPEAIVNLELYVTRALRPDGWVRNEISNHKLDILYASLSRNLKSYPEALSLLRTRIPDQG